MYREYHHWSKQIPLTKETLYYRDNGVCSYCGKELKGTHEVTIDHVIPQSKGGDKNWLNVVSACDDCNNKKGNREPSGIWKPKLKPFEPNYWYMINQRKKFPIYIDHESWEEFLIGWKCKVR